jgi:hypothetical protein
VPECELNASGIGKGPVARSCEHSNAPSGSKHGEELLTVTTSFSRRNLLLGVS